MQYNPMRQKNVVAFVCVMAMTVYPQAHAKLKKWNEKMQEMSKTLSDLLPELSESKPVSLKSQKQLEKGAKKLMDLAHTINMGSDTKGNPLPPEADPTIGFVSNLFAREAKYAYGALKAGHTAYAQATLRTMTGYCIACHTRHDRGPDFPAIHLDSKAASLPSLQKAELLTATRQFDAALDEWKNVIGDKVLSSTRPFEWGRAVRNALAISIRVKKDPDKTLTIMDQIVAMPNQPAFYVRNIPAWKQSILKWKAETANRVNTEEGLFIEAARLSKEASDVQQFPLDHSADVLYLRASAVIHDLLSQYPGGQRTSEALMMAGNAYELLEDRLVSRLPDLYYESCIRNSPHSGIAEKCFERYEQNVIFGYSGSAGIFVPEDIQALLNELRILALAKSK